MILEAEKTIIANMLFNPNLVLEVLATGLDSHHIQMTSHKAIFEALKGNVAVTNDGLADFTDVFKKTGVPVSQLLTLTSNSVISEQIAIFEAKQLVELYSKSYLVNILKGACFEIEKGIDAETVIDNLDNTLRSHLAGGTIKEKTFAELLLDFTADMQTKKRFLDIGIGIPEFDSFFKSLEGSELIVIGARPGVGKTALLTQLLVETAKRGLGSLFFSGEMSRNEIMKRIISQETEIDSKSLGSDHFLTKEEVKQLVDKSNEIANLNIFVEEMAGMTITQFCAKAKRLIIKHNLKIVAVDYLQLLEADDKKQSRYQQITDISRRLKTLAMQTKCVVICLAQLNRASDTRLDKSPQLSDLRDSGQIEQDANIVLLLSRDTQDPTKIIFDIAKNRSGTCSKIALKFINYCTKFVEAVNLVDTSRLSEVEGLDF